MIVFYILMGVAWITLGVLWLRLILKSKVYTKRLKVFGAFISLLYFTAGIAFLLAELYS